MVGNDALNWFDYLGMEQSGFWTFPSDNGGWTKVNAVKPLSPAENETGNEWDTWYTAKWSISERENFWQIRNGPNVDKDTSEFTEQYKFTCEDGVLNPHRRKFTSNNTNEPDTIGFGIFWSDVYEYETEGPITDCTTEKGELGNQVTIITTVSWHKEKGVGLVGLGWLSIPYFRVLGSPDSFVGSVAGSHVGTRSYSRTSKCCCSKKDDNNNLK
jgi:hypothetical protein